MHTEWPDVPELTLVAGAKSDVSQAQKVLLNLTEMIDYKGHNIDRLIKVPLEKLSVLWLHRTNAHILQCLNNMLKQEFLPNLSNLFVQANSDKMETFLHELESNSISKLEKLTLRGFIMSAEDLKIFSHKLTSLQVTELDLWHNCFTGNFSALFTNSLPQLNTLILNSCDLNSDSVQSLARANVQGKLPQLKHLDISDLFTNSAQWNQLTSLGTSDLKVLNVEPEFLTSLEKLRFSTEDEQFQLQSVTRLWLCLKVIDVWGNDIIRCIIDGVEQGMFPSLTIIRTGEDADVPIPHLFKLVRANISVEPF